MTVGSVERSPSHHEEPLPQDNMLLIGLMIVPVIGLIATAIMQQQLNTQMSQKNLSLKERVHIQGKQDACQAMTLQQLLALDVFSNFIYSTLAP